MRAGKATGFTDLITFCCITYSKHSVAGEILMDRTNKLWFFDCISFILKTCFVTANLTLKTKLEIHGTDLEIATN